MPQQIQLAGGKLYNITRRGRRVLDRYDDLYSRVGLVSELDRTKPVIARSHRPEALFSTRLGTFAPMLASD